MTTQDGLSYELAAKDEMSAPAHAATEALSGLTSELKRQSTALKDHATAHEDAGKHVKEHEGFIKEFTSSLIPQIAMAELAAEGIKKLGEAGLEGFKFAIEAGEFKENAIAAYTIVKGTAEEGERTFEELDRVAKNIHMPSEKAHELAQSLMLQGLKSQEAVTGTITAVSNLQRVGLGAGADKLQSIIQRGLAQGGLKVSARMLSGTGVSIDALTSDLALRLHKSTETIKEELKKGTIDTEAGIEAITHEINKGKIGALATKKFTISDALVDMKNKIRGVFDDANSGPLTDAFKNLSDSFSEGSEGAANLKESLDALVSLSGALLNLGGAALSGIASAINAAAKAAKWLADEAGRALDAITHLGSAMQNADEKKWSKQADKDIDKREDAELRGRIEKAKLDAMFAAGQPGASQETIDAAKKLGADVIVDGVTQGMVDKGKEPAAAMKVIALDSLDAAKKALDAHSPSRKMFELGGDATEGFALGADRGADRARDALSSATVVPAMRGQGAAPNDRSLSLTLHFGDVHGVAHAEDMRGIVENAMADALERIQLELGQ